MVYTKPVTEFIAVQTVLFCIYVSIRIFLSVYAISLAFAICHFSESIVYLFCKISKG